MLGWNLEKDENELDNEVEVVDEDDVNPLYEEIEEIAYSTPTKKMIGSYELLQSRIPAFAEVRSGRVARLYVYADERKCERMFHEHAGRQ